MDEVTVILRVDPELKAAFAAAAEKARLTPTQLLHQFMQDFVAQHSTPSDYGDWLSHKVEIGRQAAREGRTRDHDQVQTRFARQRTVASSQIDPIDR